MAAKPVARVGDIHLCPLHPPNAIIDGYDRVQVNSRPVAVVGSKTACGATIVTGANHIFGGGNKVAHMGSQTSHGGIITTGSPNTFVNDESGQSNSQAIVGAIKALVNQFVKSQAALSAQWLAEQKIVAFQDAQTGETLSADQAAERYHNDGQLLLPVTAEQQAGAQFIQDLPQTPAIIGVASALASRGKSVLRAPQADTQGC